MRVYVINANFRFYCTPYDLVAHLGRLLVVHVPVQNLEFDCVFDVEVGEDDRDGVARRELTTDGQERWTWQWPVSHCLYTLVVIDYLLQTL